MYSPTRAIRRPPATPQCRAAKNNNSYGTLGSLYNPISQQTMHLGKDGRRGRTVRPTQPEGRGHWRTSPPHKAPSHQVAALACGPPVLPAQQAALTETVSYGSGRRKPHRTKNDLKSRTPLANPRLGPIHERNPRGGEEERRPSRAEPCRREGPIPEPPPPAPPRSLWLEEDRPHEPEP